MHLMKRSSDSVTSVVVKREYDEEKQCEVEQPAMINPIYLKNTVCKIVFLYFSKFYSPFYKRLKNILKLSLENTSM